MKPKEQKKAEALARQEAYDKLSVAEKIKKAKSAKGESKKQLERLQKTKAKDEK